MMKKTKSFDVLVVYTHGIATSATFRVDKPFSVASKRTNYNDAYAYFLEICAQNSLSAAFTTTADMNTEGTFDAYWLFYKGKWTRKNEKCSSKMIFDKFSPINVEQEEKRTLLFSNPEIKSFNSPTLFWLFFDKQETYERLVDFTIPTVSVESRTLKNIDRYIEELRVLVALHPQTSDFSKKIVLKDRFGAGGNNIFAIDNYRQKARIFELVNKYKNTSFVIQPFARFEKGFSYKNYKGFVDIRVIYLKNKIIQVYIRVAKETDFRCNEHQGGALEYIPIKDLPKKVAGVSKQVVKLLNEKDSLYALDFVISNSGQVYLMEGNNGPGIDWNLSLKKNERMAKRLIRLIVMELARRVDNAKRNYSILPASSAILTNPWTI